jgi:uncharacterized membrane protein
MRQAFLHYAVVLVVFLAIDSIWLSTAGRTIYMTEIGQLLRDRPNFVVAFVFYALYAFGLLVFVVQPALSESGYSRAVVYGGFFGLVAYATYDMTNLATLKGFTAKIAMIDLAWGTVLSAAVSVASVWVVRFLKI